MGQQTHIYGYIEASDAEIQQIAEIVSQFDFDDVYPFRNCFSNPVKSYRVHTIAYADSHKMSDRCEWKEWTKRFEYLLSMLPFSSAKTRYEPADNSSFESVFYFNQNGEIIKLSTLDRLTAKRAICEERLSQLTADEKASHLLDWWSLDENDKEYHTIGPRVQMKLLNLDEPDDANDPIYIPLLLVALLKQLHGVTNAYLERRLNESNPAEHTVVGVIEPMMPCPCCDYLTLETKTGFEICPLCKWEYTGEDENAYSGPNHITLKEGREALARKLIKSDQWLYPVRSD
jgi:hypothetical protein